jgi:hypothetical protein
VLCQEQSGVCLAHIPLELDPLELRLRLRGVNRQTACRLQPAPPSGDWQLLARQQKRVVGAEYALPRERGRGIGPQRPLRLRRAHLVDPGVQCSNPRITAREARHRFALCEPQGRWFLGRLARGLSATGQSGQRSYTDK